jgi:hypothetical protein
VIYLLTPLFKVNLLKRRTKSTQNPMLQRCGDEFFAGQMRPKIHRMSLVVLPYRSHPQLPNVEPADKAQMALSS